LGIRAAVNLYNQRVLLLRIKAGRLEYPAIDWPVLGTGVGHVLGHRQLKFIKKWGVETGDTLQFSRRCGRTRENFCRVRCLFDEDGHPVPGLIGVEIQHVHISWSEGQWLFASSIARDSKYSRCPPMGRH